MKYLSLFSGIGSPEQALKNLGVEFELIGFSEIDKFAIKSYCAIHEVSEDLNLGDITKIDFSKLGQVDLITHGSPCQDFSIAGGQAGADEGTGTRSSLMWNTVEIVAHTSPKYVIWENVKNAISKKHIHNFNKYLDKMSELGYDNFYKVLNAKDFGVPQNRERIFIVSIRKDLNKKFEFPTGEELKIRLRDILENEVDDKYYMNKPFKLVDRGSNIKAEFTEINFDQTKRIHGVDGVFQSLAAKDRGINNIVVKARLTDYPYKQVNQVLGTEGICITLDTMQGGHREPKILQVAKIECGYEQAGRVYSTEGIGATLQSRDYKDAQKILIEGNSIYRVRKLTPNEYYRLMGFKDEQFKKAEKVCSNSQLYKQAGNSIVVNVMEAIFKNLL